MNEEEISGLIEWSHGRGFDLTLIETMPLGEIDGDRTDQYLPLSLVRARLNQRFTLQDIDYRSGGPARYVHVARDRRQARLHHPADSQFLRSLCNRVRVTCTGTLYMCLGQEDAADLRAPMRASASDDLLHAAIDEAIARKPKGHDFIIGRGEKPSISRHMSMTGG